MPHDIWIGICEQVRGQLVMVQCDGWTATNSVHLIAYMITTQDKVCTIFFISTEANIFYLGLYCHCQGHYY
jgi:hypothetical protein